MCVSVTLFGLTIIEYNFRNTNNWVLSLVFKFAVTTETETETMQIKSHCGWDSVKEMGGTNSDDDAIPGGVVPDFRSNIKHNRSPIVAITK